MKRRLAEDAAATASRSRRRKMVKVVDHEAMYVEDGSLRLQVMVD